MDFATLETLSEIPHTELSYYLGLYKTTPLTQFAVIKISGSCLEGSSLEQIAEDLSKLYSYDLIPTITHGWGSSLTERLKESGIEPKFVDGDRYTDATIMGYVEKIAEETANNLLKAIEAKGRKAKIIGPENGVIIAKDKEDSRYGKYNGDIVRIDPEPIYKAISEGFIPILSPIGISEDRKKHYNINAAVVGAELARVIDPIKYVMVTSTNGVLDKECNTIGKIVLRRDLERLEREGIIEGGMLKNVYEAQQSLEGRENGDDRSVQIVSPGNLLYELFTRKGAGTFIRNGYIVEEKPIQKVAESIIKGIIKDSFGEELADNYYKERCEEGATIFIEKNQKGIGIVLKGTYLDIFAVGKKYQGNGVGTDLINAILKAQDAENPKLSWRSKTTREINPFYFKISDDHQQFTRNGELYNGFWIGYKPPEVTALIDFMQKKPSNFK